MAGRHRKPKAGPGRHRKPPPPGRWASPVLAGLIVLGISGVGAVTALTDHSSSPTPPRSSTSSGTPSAAATAATRATPPPSRSPAPSATPSAAPSSAPLAPSSRSETNAVPQARLLITTTGRVAWVSVTVLGRRTLFAGMLRHGRTLRYSGHPLDVVIGDAGAVRLVVRGHVSAPAGSSGQVLRFTVR